MTDIVVGGKKVAVGLEWHLLPGASSERREIESIAKSMGVTHGCVVRNEDASVTVLGVYEGKDGARKISGAAWLSRAVGDASVILVEELGDGRAWVCGSRMGSPVPGFDVVVHEAQVHELINRAMAFGDFVIYSTHPSVTGYENATPRTFAEVVQDVTPPVIKQIRGLPASFTAVAILLVLVGVGYFAVTTYLEKAKQSRAAAAVLKLNAEQSKNQAEVERLAREAYRNKGIAVVNDQVLHRSATKNRLASYEGLVSTMPMNVAGWQLSGYRCDDDVCKVKFGRLALGTLRTFDQAASAAGWKVSSLRGNEAIVDFGIESTPRSEDISSVLPEADFRVAVESRLQEMSLATIKYEIAGPRSVEKDIPVPPGKPGEPPKKMEPLPWKVGVITIKGDAFFQITGSTEYIEASTVAVRSLTVDLKQNNWTMELKYVVR